MNISHSTKAHSAKATLAKAIGALAVIASISIGVSEQNLNETQLTIRCSPYPICTLINAKPTGPVLEQMLIDEAARDEQQKGKTKRS
jgi:hypothetical protein